MSLLEPVVSEPQPAEPRVRPKSIRWPFAGGFVSRVLTLTTGMAAAQATLVLAAPLLTRLYSPDDFAGLAVFVSVASLVSAVAAGRYDYAMMLPQKDRDAGSLALLAGGLAACVALAALVCAVIVRPWAIAALELKPPAWWIVCTPLGILAYSWFSLASMWQARKKRFATMARAEAAAALVCIGVQVALGFGLAPVALLEALLRSPHSVSVQVALGFGSRVGAAGLIAGQLAGRATAFAMLAVGMLRDLAGVDDVGSWQRVVRMARRYWKFPAYSAPAGLAGKGTFEVPRLMLGGLFGATVLGFFALSFRVVAMPGSLIAQAVGQVFFPEITQCRNDAAASRALIFKCCGVLFVMIIPAAVILALWAEPIFGFVFGEQWITAGRYCRLMVPSLLGQFAIAPILTCLQAFEKQDVMLAWHAAFLVLAVGALVAGWLAGSAVVAIGGLSLVSLLMYLAYFALCVYFARGQEA